MTPIPLHSLIHARLWNRIRVCAMCEQPVEFALRS